MNKLSSLIQFELFVSYPTLLVLVATIANTVQLLIAMLLHQISGLSLIICFFSTSIFNGISIWWALVKLRRTSYRKSKLLWILCQNLLLMAILSSMEWTLTTLFTLFLASAIQFAGILIGMAIGSLHIQDAYGEFKQQFIDNEITITIKQQINFHILFGLLPFLSLMRISNEIITKGMFYNTIDIFYFALIQIFQTKIMTYGNDNNLKSNWGIQAMKLAKSPMYYLLIYQCYLSLQQVEQYQIETIIKTAFCDFMIFVVSNGAVGFSTIKVQKYLQEQKK